MKEIQSGKEVQEKALPGLNLNMDKQIDVLKAFVVYYDKNQKGTSYKEIALIIKSSPTNVSESLKFWKSIGILKSDDRTYRPSQELINAIKKMEWGDVEEGWRIFRDAMRDSWFVTHLIMAFRVTTSMTEIDLLNSLGSASGASSRAKVEKPLRNLLRLLEISKIVLKDDKGNWTLNEKLKMSREQEPIIADETKDTMLVRIGSELFAVDINSLREFVVKNGKKLDDRTYNLA